MGSDAFVMPLIGLIGILLGVIAMILLFRKPETRKSYHAKHTEEHTEAETVSVLGEAVDVRELRMLRSLFGEQKGRRLGSFKDKYYRPSLDATIDKGWVKHVGSRYVITSKGCDFCRAYLKQLISDWKPVDEV